MTKSFSTKKLYLLSATLLLLAFAYNALAQENTTSSDQTDSEVTPSVTSIPVSDEYLRRAPENNVGAGENRQELMEERKDKIEERKAEVEGKIEERKMQMEDRIEEGKIKLEEKKEALVERKTALQEVRQQRIINLSANISNRMDSAIARLFTIIERLEQRILKLQEQGFITSPAEEKVREAARNLAEARTMMQNIDTEVVEATTSAEPVGRWQSVRETYLNVGKLIRQAHANLRSAVELLKTAPTNNPENVVENESTSTPTLSGI